MIDCPVYKEPCRKYVEAEMIGTKVYMQGVCVFHDFRCEGPGSIKAALIADDAEYFGDIKPRTAVFAVQPVPERIIDDIDYVAMRGEE